MQKYIDMAGLNKIILMLNMSYLSWGFGDFGIWTEHLFNKTYVTLVLVGIKHPTEAAKEEQR